MYLERGGSVVIGAFYNTSDWLPVILGGRWRSGDEIEAGGGEKATAESPGTHLPGLLQDFPRHRRGVCVNRDGVLHALRIPAGQHHRDRDPLR